MKHFHFILFSFLANLCLGQQSQESFIKFYPILKRSLLATVCEAYNFEEQANSLTANMQESDGFLSTWHWDLENKPMTIKDIDHDGLMDYTIELENEGGGCGGNIGQSERWTLFGAKPNEFIWTHTIPYRSSTGKWEKN